MSTDAKTSVFKKDKNNNLTNKECDTYVKNYNDFKKGAVSKIINPKTNKVLNDEDRINYIYDKCKQKLGIKDSQSPKSKSKSKSPESEDNEIILDSYEKVREIIYIPFNNLKKNKALIASLFRKPIAYNKGLLKLSEYLSNTNTHNNYVKSYNNTLDEIDNIINTIYNNSSQNDKNILRVRNGWVENFMYNPLQISEISQVTNTAYTIAKIKKLLVKMFRNTDYISSTDIIASKLINKPIEELRDILFYSPTNKNRIDVIKNLENNIGRYLALQFIIIIIGDELDYKGIRYYNNKKYIKIHLNILSSLITKNIVDALFNNNNNSQSISKSISWSGTPRSSSSGHSHFQSNANIERYRISKANLVAEITQNNINDTDPYLAERWEDMPIEKLRNVISIKHTEGTNTYGVAFYIRTLYQAWRNSVKDNKPFKNPYTRKEFTDNDKEYILNSMKLLYPNIETPKIGDGRSDIIVETTRNSYLCVDGINYQAVDGIYISFKYKLKLGIDFEPLLINLLNINIPENFNVDVEPEYIQQYFLDNITYLIKNNKFFGKGMPLKIIPKLHQYIGKSIILKKNDYAQYKIFFNYIKNAL